MSAMASQIAGVSIVCSTVCSGTDQRKQQSFASLVFVRGIHWWSADSPHKGPVTRKIFPLDDVIMDYSCGQPVEIHGIFCMFNKNSFKIKSKSNHTHHNPWHLCFTWSQVIRKCQIIASSTWPLSFLVLKSEYSRRTWPIPWYLMTWILVSQVSEWFNSTAFLWKAGSKVHIVNITRVITAYTLESLSSLT